MKPVILLHGGAGNWENKDIKKAAGILEKAAISGFNILKDGGLAIEAVEQAIKALENSGFFNAGLGSYKQLDGKTRMDASIIDGCSLKCGAVAAIENIQNPISAARKVMEKTDHVLLVSKFAGNFAVKSGLKKANIDSKSKPNEQETVGALALDKSGSIAAGSSTGGLANAIPGRVGDTALIGCGTYANEYAGASATGIGEAIIRVCLSRRCCEYVESGLSPQQAAEKAIVYLEEKTKSSAGVVVVDNKGRHGVYYNTKNMVWCGKS